MKIIYKSVGNIFLATLFSFILIPLCFAKTIVITGQKLINKPTRYQNVTLDLDKGSFLITNNATLEFENTTINGTISPLNPILMRLELGKLSLKNSFLNVAVSNIEQNPTNPSKFYALNILKGKVYLVGNRFFIDTPYTVGLLTTNFFDTSDFIIQHNKVYNFHGAFFLSHSSNALVSDNYFLKVSLSNILTKNGSNNVFRNNTMLLSGNNGVDILDSDKITLSENYIFSSSCYSVFILRSHQVLISNNNINSGKTYAIFIAPSIGLRGPYDSQLASLIDENISSKGHKNTRISVLNNYLAQNRYGLAATNVDTLEVRNNIFIQHFSDNNKRKFWTNNDILLSDTLNVTWDGNLYKEAFPQILCDTDEKTLKFVELPLHGGVVL